MANSVKCANINNYHVLSHQMTAYSIDAAHAPCAQCYWFLLGVKGRASIDPWDSDSTEKTSSRQIDDTSVHHVYIMVIYWTWSKSKLYHLSVRYGRAKQNSY